MENIEEAIMNPRGGKKLPPLCFLPLGPGAWDTFQSIIQPLPHKQRRTDGFIIVETENFSCIGPTLGSPVAVMALEKAVACEAKIILGFGWAGSIHPDYKIGDIVLVKSALSEEGTSEHYIPGEKQPIAGDEAYQFLKTKMLNKNIPFLEGNGWTIDAPYRETRSKVLKYQQNNIHVVEMEISSIYTVGKYRGVSVAAVVVISDELTGSVWKSGYHNPLFQDNIKKIASCFIND